MRIIISGGSGLVGGALTDALRADGRNVAHLVRPGRAASTGDIRWDPPSVTIDAAAMEGADAVVHLSGAGVADSRWTPDRKQILRGSRVDTTRILVDSIGGLKRKPRVFLCASATGYYGDCGDELLTEAAPCGSDFLSLLARDWEAEAMRAQLFGIRPVILRFGVILSGAGGALPRMLKPFRFGLGGRLGSGRQWMAWIALEDAVEIARLLLADAGFSGPVNVVAPNPARNAEFTRAIANVLHRPAIFRAPAFALRLALGEMADAVLLASQRALPERLLSAGYSFRWPDLEPALRVALAMRRED